MTAMIDWIMESIRAYGPWSVFAGVIIESVIVPIPSPLIIMGAGFILISSELSFLEALVPIALQIVLPGAIASTLGAYIGYAIGYYGGKPLVDQWERFLGFSWRDVEALERRFQSGQVKNTIFFLRALPIFPLSVISAAAGLLRLPLNQFSALDFLRHHPALFTARLSGLGSWRNLSRLRQRHRSGRRNRLRDLAGSDFGRDRLAARPSEKQYARQRLEK